MGILTQCCAGCCVLLVLLVEVMVRGLAQTTALMCL
jgi:hypothetical protein